MGKTKAKRGESRWRRLRRRLLWLCLLLAAAPILLVAALRFIDPPGSAFMLAYALQRTTDQPPLRHDWVPLEGLSPQLQMAVIASEDQRFAEHAGFDIDAIRDALEDGSGRGASTITQQVAKNLFLWSDRSWLRKGLEAGFTACIETLWPKRRILEVYLNIAEFGPGIYGAEAAARHYFGKSAHQLTLDEAARLAAILPSPRRYSVRDPGPVVAQRVAWIIRQVRQLGGTAALEAIDDGGSAGKEQ